MGSCSTVEVSQNATEAEIRHLAESAWDNEVLNNGEVIKVIYVPGRQ
jgi:hypothetical protein